jgi:hypothetical protein
LPNILFKNNLIEMPSYPKPYAGLKASLLTQHGKESVIYPHLLLLNHFELLDIFPIRSLKHIAQRVAAIRG